jgi:opine dehydrogenase
VISRKQSVAVLGAGHGGLALAGYLGHQGHRVALWNRSLERVAPVWAQGGIRLTRPHENEVFARISLATSNMAAAVSGAGVVLVAVPASGHVDIAQACAPYLRNGQTVLLLPGRTGGSLEFRSRLRAAGCRAHILLGEASTFPFAARCTGPAAATIFGAKADVRAAALPATRTEELLAECRPLLPMLSPARSVLETGLANLGAILHPAITLLNAERIERGDSFDFYADGVTAAVAETLAAADAERLRIARTYRVPACSLQDWVAEAYGHHAVTVRDAVGGNPAYVGIKAPKTLEHRYLLEDVPTGLIPLIELGEAAGLAVPTLKGLVDRCRIMLGGEPWQHQRTLDVLGLDNLCTAEIRALVEGESVQPIRRPLLPVRTLSGMERNTQTRRRMLEPAGSQAQ